MILLLLAAWLAQAQAPELRLVSTRIWAPNQTVKPVLITLTVRNETPALLDGAVARVVLTPLYKRTGARGVPPGAQREAPTTMLDPWTLDAPLPALQPGQSRSIVVETPYLASGAFSTTGRTFWVENLIPNLRRTVPIQVEVRLISPGGA